MKRNRRAWLLGFIWVWVVILIAGWQGSLQAADTAINAQAGVPGHSYVYLFDEAASAFVFTFTHPELDATLWDVEVVEGSDPTEVWFTEHGADRLGKLVYTSTQDYVYQPYVVPVGSTPLNLVLDDGYAWFTAPGHNAIGRLDRATGATAEFIIPTSASYPADLDVAADGDVWFTERDAGQIAQLVVTSTLDYHIEEYQGPSYVGGKPYGIVNHITDTVYFAEMEKNDVVYADLGQDRWIVSSDPVYELDGPFNIVQATQGKIWATEYTGNGIGMANIGVTSAIIRHYPLSPANSRPHSLVLDNRGEVWFTQEGAGQLGHLIPGLTSDDILYYPLPVPNLNPRGIAMGESGEFWLVASRPYVVALPLVMR